MTTVTSKATRHVSVSGYHPEEREIFGASVDLMLTRSTQGFQRLRLGDQERGTAENVLKLPEVYSMSEHLEPLGLAS